MPSSRAHAAAFHHRGQAFAAKGNLDQAISDISAGIRVDPQPAYRWQERGELYARQGKYQQAVADITEAIRRDPTPRAFRFHSRAQAYQSLGDLTRAIADFDEAIRLDPEARSFRFHARANALRDAGQYDRALADYETALKLAPTNAWVLVDRGRTYARMGRSEAAKNDFDSALTLSPSNEELRRIIEVEVAALPRLSPPFTAQETPSQSSQQPAPAQRSEDAALPGQSPPSTAQETPSQSSQQPAPAQRPEERQRQRAEQAATPVAIPLKPPSPPPIPNLEGPWPCPPGFKRDDSGTIKVCVVINRSPSYAEAERLLAEVHKWDDRRDEEELRDLVARGFDVRTFERKMQGRKHQRERERERVAQEWAAWETAERNRAEAERKFQAERARRAEQEHQRRAEIERAAKLPVNRLYRAYSLYSFIQLCNQVREGYLATSINDVELQRARTASKAIEKELIAKDPTIDPDKTFAEADQSARSVLSRFKGRETSEAFRRECKSALDELLSASPVSPYQTQRP